MIMQSALLMAQAPCLERMWKTCQGQRAWTKRPTSQSSLLSFPKSSDDSPKSGDPSSELQAVFCYKAGLTTAALCAWLRSGILPDFACKQIVLALTCSENGWFIRSSRKFISEFLKSWYFWGHALEAKMAKFIFTWSRTHNTSTTFAWPKALGQH